MRTLVGLTAVMMATPVLAGDAKSWGAPVVIHVRLSDEPITPVTLRFIERALREAQAADAQALVIELDTPAGLLQSTRKIVQDVLRSEVPVVVYVSPSGARAASAGLFITLSSHVAAMAPGTHIGAAHPVQMAGLPFGPDETPKETASDDEKEKNDDGKTAVRKTPMDEKIINDTTAWVRSLAEHRGRNAEWAVLAVTESRSIIAAEAVQTNVVDFMATDLDDLLAKIDGREVSLVTGRTQLHTSGAEVRSLDMWWGERLLGVLSNPNIALLLMVFGFYGVLFELYSPGWGVAGTLGVLCLLLSLFGLSVLPVNYVGLALIALALALFVAEAFVSSFGALTVGGIICMVLGGLMLVDSPTGFGRVSVGVLVPIAVATGLVAAFLLTGILRIHRSRALTGTEGLFAQSAVALDDFAKTDGVYTGSVRVAGEIWHAISESPVTEGQTLDITLIEGLVLDAEPQSEGRHNQRVAT